MAIFNDVRYISTGEYFNNNEYAVDMFESKYAHNIDDRKETPAEVFHRVASELANFESEDKKQHYIDMGFDLMYKGGFRPGGSIISGIGSGRKSSLANCTTIPIEYDTIEAINKAEYVLLKCVAYRQGVGIDLSNLRPSGSKLGNAAEESTGIVPGAKKYSNVGKYVGQKGRMPAVLESLKDHHPDIEEFINSKREKGEIENANISVQISDNFMSTLENNGTGELKFDTEHESIRKEIDSNYLFDLIAKAAGESAEPAVQYIDRLRAGTISHAVYEATGNDIYKVISTNACCFIDDMIVSTNKGDLSISEIREKFNSGVEIKILSYDIENNSFEYQDLEDTHTRDNENPQEIIELMIEKNSGEEVKIECTPDHKFYTKNRGWIKAIELCEDDILCES